MQRLIIDFEALALLCLILAACDHEPRRDAQTTEPSAVPPCVAAPLQSRCSDGRCLIAPGCFTMGSPPTEPCHGGDEQEHEVVLTRGIVALVSEVTQGQFQALMGYNPSVASACGPSCPVENTTWHEAAAYCNALSLAERREPCYQCTGAREALSCVVEPTRDLQRCGGYRLPTEAEWEYAARGQSKTAFAQGQIAECHAEDKLASTCAWYAANSGSTPHAVGGKAHNGWGLQDMAGNVAEWTHDYYAELLGTERVVDPSGPVVGSARVIRGGSWRNRPLMLRAANRTHAVSTARSADVGFRCVRSEP